MTSVSNRIVPAVLLVAGICLAGLCGSSASYAEPSAADRETARALMVQGLDKMQARDPSGALDAFLAANEIMHVPTTALAAARAHAALGQLVEARDRALEAVRYPKRDSEPEAFKRARAEATELAAALGPRIPSVELTIRGLPAGTPVRVRIDRKTIPAATLGAPRKLNPGLHEISAHAPGYAAPVATIQLAEGRTEHVTLEMAPGTDDTPPEPVAGTPVSPAAVPEDTEESQQRRPHSLAYLGFGLGAAGLMTGVVAGALALSKQSSLNSECDASTHLCPASAQSDIDAGRQRAMISNIGFGVGIVGIGLGVASLLWPSSNPGMRQRRSSGAAMQPWAGQSGLGMGVSGCF